VNRSITLLRAWLLVCVVSLGLAQAQSVNESFERRFETIKKTATKEQLYRFLYALPKGGDLHNHLGLASMAEDWWAAATDPRLGGTDWAAALTQVKPRVTGYAERTFGLPRP